MSKMTKKNNATVNPVEVNYDRLCPEYFHLETRAEESWWSKLPFTKMLTGNTVKVKIPTPAELEELGKSNLTDLRLEMRRRDKKLAVERRTITYGLKKLNEIENLDATSDKIYCDWHGAGSSCMHTCKFGTAVADWCEKTPSPLRCDGRCYCFECDVENGMESIDALEPLPVNQAWRCPHYDKCHGDKRPFLRETCIFERADKTMVQNCIEALYHMLDHTKHNIETMEKYFVNIKTASESKTLINKPSFNFQILHQLANIAFGTTVVLIERRKRAGKNEHAFLVRRGVLANIVSYSQCPRHFIINMPDGEVERISSSMQDEYRYPGVCMTQDNFNYLLDNPEYRGVWLRMINVHDVDFTREELESILLRFASLRNATR